ncbi:MAG: LAGLIDADG family homing endonuclease, partial [Planctomycetota bacterium]|jgi:DNA polymerase elongation subunit (family B)
VVHKKRRQKEYDMHDQRQKVLKWLLVTCLDGETIVPYEEKGEVKLQQISKIIDKYLPSDEGVLEVNNNFQVFGLKKDLKFAKVPVKKIFKFRSPETLLHLRLQQGRELWVTKDHPCYILDKGQLKVKRADELKGEEYFPIITGFDDMGEDDLHLNLVDILAENLPSEELPLWRAFGKDLHEVISRSYNSIRASALKNYSEKSIWNWRKYGYIPFQFISQIPMNNGQLPIEYIGRGRRGGGEIQRIPAYVKVDFDLGFLLGYFIGDGNAKNNMVRFAINSKDRDVMEMLSRIIRDKFGLSSTLRKENHANMFVLQVNSIALKQVIEIGLDVPCSAREGKLKIPSIVLNGTHNVKFGFLSGLIASDGHVSEKRNFVNIVSYDYAFIKSIGLLLSMLGLEYRVISGKNIHEIQLRNLRQLRILHNNGWLKAKHRKRLEEKVKNNHLPRESQIPVIQSGLLHLSKKARITRNPRVTRRQSISLETAKLKFDQLSTKQGLFTNEEYEYLEHLKALLQSKLTFVQIVSIEEVSSRTPFVYCFEIAEGLPGFIVEGNIFTHNCFGYTGYRNARFGRIECHESITAYAREILLDAMEVVESMGYRVLHGIVDSLWVTLNGRALSDDVCDGFKTLCEAVAERTGINIEFEGYYRWLVFLPNKATGAGALTRYYGLLDNGKFKVRGVELRQRSTPKFFIKFQQKLLDTLATVSTKQELQRVVKDDALRAVSIACSMTAWQR